MSRAGVIFSFLSLLARHTQPNGTIIFDTKASIHEQHKIKSGSEMKEEDFLHLKAAPDSTKLARIWTILRISTGTGSGIGMLWAMYGQQCLVPQMLHGRSQVKRAYGMNEELVNMSLVNFIQAVKEKKKAKEIDSRVYSLSGETDGLLESRATGRMHAILEAKARWPMSERLPPERSYSYGPVSLRGASVMLSAKPDYEVWYGKNEAVAMNVVIVEAKTTDLESGVAQTLGHGLATNGVAFHFLKISNASRWSEHIMTLRSSEIGKPLGILVHMFCRAALMSPTHSKECSHESHC
ncbi:uncharacterized protein N7515_001943 [Penicillium bovifimosum]|uniref:Uncharacterized protein n=1 Tax=Penicillium bovifimosum TaxID=126998 RepID=A0A9W9HAM0_9EURO|nr:uncharacterized protein N7515_001943 [Penicillium bovifimosum]KAJ5143156.1 hypothetical protein N7515_001943 [Penicillium bovifimosum]